METWYRLEQIYEVKAHKSPFGNYRERVAKSHARYCRTLAQNEVTAGRPRKITVIDATGAQDLLGEAGDVGDLTPAVVPVRFKDAVRQVMEGINEFSTSGLEEMPRVLTRDQFIDFLKRDRPDLVDVFLEEDFANI